MDGETVNLIGTLITAVGGVAIAYFQWRQKTKADRRAQDEQERREREAAAQATRDELDRQRHTAVVGRLDRIEQGQESMREEIKRLHQRDGELAIEIERRAARIEGHLGLHGRPRDGGHKGE